MPPDAPPTRSLLVIEDGHEYEEFARLFLADGFAIRAAHSAAEALARLTEAPADAFLVDLRFERSPVEHLIGDVDATARRAGRVGGYGGPDTRASGDAGGPRARQRL